MQPENQTSPQTTESAVKTGLYWRRSWWRGSKTVPVILMLENGTLTMKTQDSVVFSEPIREITSAVFTGFGTLLLKVRGDKYSLAGLGAGTSKDFSAEQKQELQQAAGQVNTAAGQVAITGATLLAKSSGTSGGLALGGVGVALNGISSFFWYKEAGKRIRVWEPVLRAAGIQTRMKKPIGFFKALMIYLVAIIGILIGPAVIAVLIYAVVKAV